MKAGSVVALALVLAAAAGGVVGTLLMPSAYSQPQAPGQVGRFVKVGITVASPAWRAQHAADTQIIWTMDSTNGTILGCGDATGQCAVAAGSSPRK